MSISNDDITLSNESQTDNEVRESIYISSRVSVIEDPQEKKPVKILGALHGIGMNVNNIIGSGIVTTPGIIWSMVKSPGIVLLLWLIGGIISMAGSLSYVELGVIHKISGGETKYLQTAYPKPKILMSYLFSFMHIFAIRPGIISAVLQSAAQYSWFTINGRGYDEDMQDKSGWKLPFSPFWFTKLLAVAFLFIITAYHMINNKWANYINQTLAVIKLITYSTIAIAGIYNLFAHWSVSRVNWQKPLKGDTSLSAYSASILLIMFSYDGWNTLNYSLDEFRKPEKKLIFSNSISVGIVTLIYLLVNISFFSVVPENSILNSDNINETIAATFFYNLFGESVVRIFTALIVLSVIGTAASGVWSGSRVIVAAATSDFFPKYSKNLRTWNSYFNTPTNALFVQFIWISFIILFVGSSFTITSFRLFSTFSMYSYWIFYFATGIGLLVIRRRNLKKKQSERNDEELNDENSFILSNTGYKVPLPFAVIFILAGLFILIFSFVIYVECSNCSEADLREKRIQNMAPIFISYGFLFIALIFWYFFYYWWGALKKQREATIMRIAPE